MMSDVKSRAEALNNRFSPGARDHTGRHRGRKTPFPGVLCHETSVIAGKGKMYGLVSYITPGPGMQPA